MPKKYFGETILFFVTLIAASGWFFSKNALSGFPPIGFIGVCLLSMFILGERLSGIKWLGCGLILAALIIYRLPNLLKKS